MDPPFLFSIHTLHEVLMEVDCSNCGSQYEVIFNEEQTTSETPLFCSFCGESIDGQKNDFWDEEPDF